MHSIKMININYIAFLVTLSLMASDLSAQNRTYRTYSGGSESSHSKIIRSVDDAKLYKEDQSVEEARARPIYEELNQESSEYSTKEIKKRVYVSRSGSAMSRPKIITQR